VDFGLVVSQDVKAGFGELERRIRGGLVTRILFKVTDCVFLV
jgi:hypothetical protein